MLRYCNLLNLFPCLNCILPPMNDHTAVETGRVRHAIRFTALENLDANVCNPMFPRIVSLMYMWKSLKTASRGTSIALKSLPV